jgi:hypothetical protein
MQSTHYRLPIASLQKEGVYIMSHHTATVQVWVEKTAITYDAALDHLYRIDETYVQPFYVWAAPQLRDAAISGLYWSTIAIIEIAHWLIDATQRFMAVDAEAIAYLAFAQAHEPVPKRLALCPAFVPLALPAAVEVTSETSLVVSIVPVQLALCPAMMPLSIGSIFGSNASSYMLNILNSGVLGMDYAISNKVVCQPNGFGVYVPVVGQFINPKPTDMHRENARRVAPAKAEDELASSLLVPGATGKRTRKPRAKAEPKTSARKRKEVKVGQ